MARRIAYVALGLLAVIAVAGAAFFLMLGRYDFASLAASRASASLGRPVSVASLHVAPGRWLTIDLQGVKVDNIPGGTQPDMATLTSLHAEVELLSLLHGPANIRRLDIDGLMLLLERTADGSANWRRPGAPPPPPKPEDRSGFPTLTDLHIQHSQITDRTSRGKLLPIRLDDATIHTASADAPVQMQIAGAYRGLPVTLTADLQPIAVLRDAATPYGADIHIASGTTTLRFQGTMTKPLDVDGARGTLTLHAPSLTTLLAMIGAKGESQIALDIAGDLTRADMVWRLTGASGKLDESSFTNATLGLTQGGRGLPDSVDVDLAFDRLALDPLLKGPKEPDDQSGFRVDPDPDPRLSARVSARQVSYQGNSGTDLLVAAALKPARADLDNFAVTAFGARLQAAAHAEATGKASRLTADATVSGMDVQQLRQIIGARSIPMTGRLDAQLAADVAGEDLVKAAPGGHIAAVLAMRDGSISRDIVEKASLDIRRLFREPKGMTPVSCLLAVIQTRAGIGDIAPLRIRTASGSIAGQGRVDLVRRALDLTIGSQSATTSDFALDVPIRISGPFSDPSIRPSSGSPALATGDLSQLPPALSRAARQNPCVTAR